MGRGAAQSETGPGARGLRYADAGVSIEAGDRFASMIQAMVRRTHGPRVIRNDLGFAGLFRLDYNEKLFKRNYREPVLVACADGVGTKIKLAQALDRWDTIGIDLVAMNVNDLIVQGAEPLFFLDYIATARVEPERLAEIIKGVTEGCARSGAALLGGETAEMPGVYPPGEIDLAGFAVGVVELPRAIDPARVEPGDVVLGLAASGIHSNGYTLVRAIVERAGLDLDEPRAELDGRRLGEALLEPTRLYVQPVVRVQRAYRVKKVISGMAHITGGGLAGNLARALHVGVDAQIDPGAWPVPPIFRLLQEAGGVEEAEMRRVFNMGIGYCLIVRPAFADSITRRLRRFGETVHRIGRITPGSGRVVGV
ncbi:MAG: phosphoribosylformylglycinamidine cyclo-ligase [Planctomycetota bacterium]|nr:MAG: phosphoribosylformylglycinamidine cyclo-ligase [Planctomycetota bacterium]